MQDVRARLWDAGQASSETSRGCERTDGGGCKNRFSTHMCLLLDLNFLGNYFKYFVAMFLFPSLRTLNNLKMM